MNLRDGCWTGDLVLDLLGDATIVKVNEHEADVLLELVGAATATPRGLATALRSRYGVERLCITRGAAGATLLVDGGEFAVEGIPVDVVDTVGAGDAFAAGLLHGLLRGETPAEALAFANRLGALVASRPGALPTWRADELAGG